MDQKGINGHHKINLNGNDESGLSSEDLHYREKFHIMSKRCKQIEADNLRLINLIYHTKKITKKCCKEKKILIDRLDQKKDKFRSIKRPEYVEVKEENEPTVSLAQPPDTQPPLPAKESPKSPTKKLESTPSTPAQNLKPPSKSSNKTNRSDKGQKKPINPYLMFCKENRAKVQEEYQKVNGREMNNTELTKELANRWQTINPDLKLDYQSRYEVEKEKYNVIKLLQNASQSDSSFLSAVPKISAAVTMKTN